MRRRVSEFFRLLLREYRSPARVALAVGIGCVIGCTPLYGFHLPLCVLAALLLRLNKLIVYGAANISVPPLAPLIGFVSVELGEYALHRSWLHRELLSGLAVTELARRFFVAWLLGGVLLGAVVGLLLGGATYLVLRRRRRATAAAEDPIRTALARARRRYTGAAPRFRHYARFKYRLDPCYRAICGLVPPGARVADLGTGLGMLPVALGELGEGRRAIGVEWDRAKAECGARAAQGLPGIEIVAGDLRTWEIPPCDVVTLVDVLHYFDAPVRSALLRRAAGALCPGGMLLIRDGDRRRGGAARWTRFVERLAVRLGWNRAPAVDFLSMDDLGAELRSLGLQVEECAVAGALLPGNVLLSAALASAPSPAPRDRAPGA